jgi:propionyl-CoA synthetase
LFIQEALRSTRSDEDIQKDIVQMIRDTIGPIASYKATAVGEQYTLPSTIDDPTTLDEIEVALKGIGYGKK